MLSVALLQVERPPVFYRRIIVVISDAHGPGSLRDGWKVPMSVELIWL